MRKDDFDQDSDLREADELLRKADALLSRGRAGSGMGVEDDDLPLVTEIIPAVGLPRAPAPEAMPEPDLEPEPEPDTEMTEQLIDLDTAIQREIEAWMAREMPEIIERELELLQERIRTEVMASMRVGLLPRLSEEIASRLPGAERPVRRR